MFGFRLPLSRILLAETQNGRQSFIDAPLLVWGDPPHQVAKLAGVDGADLLDEDYRARQQLVGLDDHFVPPAALLVARPARGAEFVNVTPQHTV
jgi:hypothetical protein